MARWIFLRALLGGLVTVPWARLRRGPLRPSWSLGYELVVHVMKRSFAEFRRHDYPRQRRYSESLSLPVPILRQARFTEADAGGVPSEWCEPKTGTTLDAVYVFFHGGGYNGGSPGTHREWITRQTLALGCRTLAVSYRLAPEHAFPAPIDDALTVYRWLLARGVAADRIIFGGDSAGGNLVLATLLSLREHGLPQPRAGVCLCPWVDLGDLGGSIIANTPFDWAEPEHVATWARDYLQGRSASDPFASPVLADLRGLCPLLVQVGTAEMLLDQVRRFVAAAKQAGVKVTCTEYEDMVHDWHLFGALFPQSLSAIDEIGTFGRAALAKPG